MHLMKLKERWDLDNLDVNKTEYPFKRWIVLESTFFLNHSLLIVLLIPREHYIPCNMIDDQKSHNDIASL